MRVYIENLRPKMSPYNGKGKFAQRLAKALGTLGVEVVDKSDGCDIRMRMNALPTKGDGASVVRLDDVAYSNEAMHLKIKGTSNLKEAIDNADGIIYQSITSQLMCDGILGKAKGKVSVINNGVDPEGFKGESVKLEGRKNFLIACQFMHPMRRPELISYYWREFIRGRKDAWLHVVTGEDMADVDFSTLPNVKVYGLMEQQELNAMMRACDALISIKYQDSCPNAVIESIACGTPSIVSNTNGLCKVLGTPWIWTINIDPYRTLKEADWHLPPVTSGWLLEKQLEYFYDNEKTEFEFPEDLHINTVAKRYLELFEEIL